jgi:hypothetical protein
MNAYKCSLFVLTISALAPAMAEGVSSCSEPVKGNWSFGYAPKGCNLKFLGAEKVRIYEPLIYEDGGNQEIQRYTQKMFSFLRDSADFYYAERKNSASQAEKLAWRQAVLALAHQESYWTHYRYTARNKQLKFMRGDGYYGHGILQIDERWHKKIALSSKGEDLATNIMYGLDLFYKSWESAIKASCVQKGNLEQRARTAYASYNGGPNAKCRWTNQSAKFARNDKGFLEKLRGQDWKKYAVDSNLKSPVNVQCVVDGGNGCGEGVAMKTAIYFLPLRSATIQNKLNEVAMLRRSIKNKFQIFI